MKSSTGALPDFEIITSKISHNVLGSSSQTDAVKIAPASTDDFDPLVVNGNGGAGEVEEVTRSGVVMCGKLLFSSS